MIESHLEGEMEWSRKADGGRELSESGLEGKEGRNRKRKKGRKREKQKK